jgi:hypothetical protein
MDWARILAYVTGLVDQELLARSEYLAAENRILKAQLQGRLKLSDAERATLGKIGHRLGRKVLGEAKDILAACRIADIPSRLTPAMCVGVVSLQLVKSFAMYRTKANVKPPATIPQIMGADTQSQLSVTLGAPFHSCPRWQPLTRN